MAVEAVTSGAVSIPVCTATSSPAARGPGAAWQGGRLHVWEEHLASATVRTIVEILYPDVLKAQGPVASSGRCVLLACPPEEGHDLGLRMVVRSLRHGGLDDVLPWAGHAGDGDRRAACDLGVDAVVPELVDALPPPGSARTPYDTLRTELPGVNIWVGGPAFVARDRLAAEEMVDLDGLLGDAEQGGDEVVGDDARGADEVAGDDAREGDEVAGDDDGAPARDA